jgi:hypothetical protein
VSATLITSSLHPTGLPLAAAQMATGSSCSTPASMGTTRHSPAHPKQHGQPTCVRLDAVHCQQISWCVSATLVASSLHPQGFHLQEHRWHQAATAACNTPTTQQTHHKAQPCTPTAARPANMCQTRCTARNTHHTIRFIYTMNLIARAPTAAHTATADPALLPPLCIASK